MWTKVHVSCWVVKTKPIAVKYVCSTLGDMSCFSDTKKKEFQELKVQQFSLFWVRSLRSTHERENQKTNSAFVIYCRAFTGNINNSKKCFLGKHHNLEYSEFELRNYKSYSRPPSCDRILCRNSCEMWSETRWTYKGIHINSNSQDVYSSMLIFQSQDIDQKFWVSETTQKKYYKNIWRVKFVEKVMHIIQLSYVSQDEVVQVFFFYSDTYTDNLVAEFPVLAYLCSTSLYPINFKKASRITRKWKIDLDCECLVIMQS